MGETTLVKGAERMVRYREVFLIVGNSTTPLPIFTEVARTVSRQYDITVEDIISSPSKIPRF